MIIFTAKIYVLPKTEESLSFVSSNLTEHEISAELSSVFGKKTIYDNPFILGASKLGQGGKFCANDTKPYFISSEIAGVDGSFDSQPYIYIEDTSSSLTSITIAFDTTNNRHPNTINVDGVDYSVDASTFTVLGITASSYHTIKITDWNAPNFPLVITGIYANVYIEIDRRNLISLETSLYDRGDLELPSFGVISNTGNIEFIDDNEQVGYYAYKRLLQKGLMCEIYLKNTLCPEATKRVAVYETDSWAYDNENHKVSVSLKDDLEKWQEINIEGISYDARNPVEKTLWYFFHELSILTFSNGYEMDVALDAKTTEVLNNTIIKYPLLYSSSLWAAWDKVCQVGQLHIYKENGIVKCRYNGGN